jgi:hypothetical protein
VTFLAFNGVINTNSNELMAFYAFYPLAGILSPILGVLSVKICTLKIIDDAL